MKVHKLLITGPPRSGKSTLVSKLIEYYSDRLRIFGFITPEVREKGLRVGFDVEDIHTKERFKLARSNEAKTAYKVGKYSVFMQTFDEYLSKYLNVDLIQCDLIIIDEIGKMELFSEIFQILIKKVFTLDISIIATIGENLNHPVKTHLLNTDEIQLVTISFQNRDNMYNQIITLIL